MSTIASLNVLIAADNESFIRAFDKSNQKVEEFNVSARGAKIGVAQLGQAFGAQGQVLGGVAQAMFVLGPAAGVAVAALELVNRVVETQVKNIADAQKNAEAYTHTMIELGQAMGTIPTEGPFTSDLAKSIEEINKQLEEEQKQFDAASNDWLSGGTRIRQVTQDMNKLRDAQREFLKLKNELEPTNILKDNFEESDFQVKISTEKGSIRQLNEEFAITSQYANDLKDTLETLPENGTAYLRVLKEYRQEYLKVLDIQDQIKKKNEEAAKEILKSQEGDANNRFEQNFQKSLDAAKKLKELVETPAEKFEEHMKNAVELFNRDLISDDQINKYLKMEEDAFAKAENKESPIVNASFKQLDPSKIDAAGLSHKPDKKQEITSKQLETTNAILEKINAKFGIATSEAVVGKG